MNAPFDFQTAEKRLDPYQVVTAAAKELIEREAEAVKFLQSLGYRLIRPCK